MTPTSVLTCAVVALVVSARLTAAQESEIRISLTRLHEIQDVPCLEEPPKAPPPSDKVRMLRAGANSKEYMAAVRGEQPKLSFHGS